ncbi:MAG TPA: hypothetical protein VHJ37_00075 [Thermoleophilaceae bacterium]|nr:hypothetical protein [Thermoleophilaceae bacterium]
MSARGGSLGARPTVDELVVADEPGAWRDVGFRVAVAADPDGPARRGGIAFLVEDMEATARTLGPLLGSPRAAIQPGRAIATLSGEAGLGPAIAFMT